MLDSPAPSAAPRAAWDLTTSAPWHGADPADELAELAGAVAEMVAGIHRAVLTWATA